MLRLRLNSPDALLACEPKKKMLAAITGAQRTTVPIRQLVKESSSEPRATASLVLMESGSAGHLMTAACFPLQYHLFL